MPKIFISYRRADSQSDAQTIFNRLSREYGKTTILFDVDSIPRGIDFVRHLNQQLHECDLLIAVIGDQWLARDWLGRRRINQPNDFVRMEIGTALKREIPVLPVLVGLTSTMPTAAQLPQDLKSLLRYQAAVVRPGLDNEVHLERLVRDIERILDPGHPPQPETSPSDGSSQESTLDVKKEVVPPDSTEPIVPARKDLVTNSIRMIFQRIEPGTFKMERSYPDGGTSNIIVSWTERYWLGVHPVTQAQYEQVMDKNPSHFKGDDRRPIESVSWFEAIEFCNRLSQQEGLEPYYECPWKDEVRIRGGLGYRLPFEAEWEHACRAGSRTKYFFGDDERQLNEYAWHKENSYDTTHPVGQKMPNGWGLYDMHGNVEEWCWDWYGDLDSGDNPIGPPEGEDRVFRGGSWSSDRRWFGSSYRARTFPKVRNEYTGFRVARNYSQEKAT